MRKLATYQRKIVRFFSGLTGLLFLSIVLGYATPTKAQLSPWLSLDNRPTGSLDSFNQYVRPQMQNTSILTQQQQQINRQNVRQQAMAREMGSTLSAPQPVGSRVYAASFRNYTHYYTMPRSYPSRR